MNGVWHELEEENADGTKPAFLIARQHHRNRAWFERWSELSKKYDTSALENPAQSASYDQMTEGYVYLSKLYPGTILLDWRDYHDDYGNEIVYSEKAAEEELLRMPDFAEWVTVISTEADHYRAEARLVLAKK